MNLPPLQSTGGGGEGTSNKLKSWTQGKMQSILESQGYCKVKRKRGGKRKLAEKKGGPHFRGWNGKLKFLNLTGGNKGKGASVRNGSQRRGGEIL